MPNDWGHEMTIKSSHGLGKSFIRSLAILIVLLGLPIHPASADGSERIGSKRIDPPGEASPAQISKILVKTNIISVNCGDDVDMQTCKFFVNALNVADI
jgi:hypothetical protein